MSSEYVIGLDLGGSSVKWVAATRTGEVLARGNNPFDAARPLHFAEIIREIVASVLRDQRGRWTGIGLSAPGLAARDAKSIAFMPGRLHGLEKLNWEEYLETPFPVPVLNDAHSALLGEAWVGAAAGCANVFMLTLGTGVGGAAMVDGRLLLGNIGRAGHMGHATVHTEGPVDVAGMPGSIEIFMGNCSIGPRSKGRFPTTHDLIKAHQAGDPGATEIWLKSVRDLAFAIASFINILDPEMVIIGGGIARAGQTLFEPLEKYLRPIEWQPGGHQVRIAPATLGEYAGALGAARRACQS